MSVSPRVASDQMHNMDIVTLADPSTRPIRCSKRIGSGSSIDDDAYLQRVMRDSNLRHGIRRQEDRPPAAGELTERRLTFVAG